MEINIDIANPTNTRRIRVGGSESEPLRGISFPSNADNPTSAYVAIEFDNPEDNGLPIWGPSNAGVTVIREINVRQQTAEPVNNSYYYAQFWYTVATRGFDTTHYWGFHPYPQGGNPGTDPNSFWEIATEGNDWTTTLGSTQEVPEFNRWYTQACVVSKPSSTENLRFYIDLPSTANSKIIERNAVTAGYGEAPTTNSLISIGDSPWHDQGAQHERFSGILGRIKIFKVALSQSDILSEADDMSQLVTTAGQNNIWWGKNNFRTINDLICDYGTNRSFHWFDTNNKGTLVLINP